MYGVAIFDGELVQLSELRLATFFDGFFFGCGLFETLALDEGTPQFLERHLKRMRRSFLRLPAVKAPRAELLELTSVKSMLSLAVSRVQESGCEAPNVMRITASDGHVLVTFRDFADGRAHGLHQGVDVAMLDSKSYRSGDVFINHKTTSYIRSYSSIESNALFANERGEVCESAKANVFFLLSDRLVTPPLESPCLPGIVREVLLEVGSLDGLPMVEELVPVEALTHALGAFLTNSVSVAIPVATLLGRALGESDRVAASARQLISQAERRERLELRPKAHPKPAR